MLAACRAMAASSDGVAALAARAPAKARRLMEAHLLRAVQHFQRPAAGVKHEGGRRGRRTA